MENSATEVAAVETETAAPEEEELIVIEKIALPVTSTFAKNTVNVC